MTKPAENSVPEIGTVKKTRWPLLIGVWALVEAVASGWGVGAAFLVHHLSVKPVNKNDRLEILRNPETAKQLSSFQALQFLSASSMFLFIPYVLYMIGISLIKVIPLQGLFDASLLFIDDLCIYVDHNQCPKLISFNYILINIIFIFLILLFSIINTDRTVITNMKINIFNFIYKKWMMNIFVIFSLGFFLYLISIFFKKFISLFIDLLSVDAVNFNVYLQGSTALISIPFFVYMITVYIYSLKKSLVIISMIRGKEDKELYVLYSNILNANRSKEIRQLAEMA